MTAAAIAEFNRTSSRYLQYVKQREPADAPDSVVTPQVLPSNDLSVDGEVVEVVSDLQRDVLATTNSFFWISSLQTVIAGDIVFSGVYPYLAHSNETTHAMWQRSLDGIAALHPRAVLAGHKRSVDWPMRSGSCPAICPISTPRRPRRRTQTH
jgi:hypothetical protein